MRPGAPPSETHPEGTTSTAPALELRDVTAGYGRFTALRDVNLTVAPGSVSALLGPNGAGKTTLLGVAAGLLRPTCGQVLLGGTDVTGWAPFHRARRGLCLIPEGRGVFPNLTVRENLRLQVPRWSVEQSFEPALDAFPELKRRLNQRAGTMSGGQQQMLALSRCFLTKPELVLLDEVSMGLAPRVIDEIFAALETLRASGVSLLLVEQYVSRALQAADRVQLMVHGTIAFSGSAREISETELMGKYFGSGE